MPSAQTRRFVRLPSAVMSNAVRRPANDSADDQSRVVRAHDHAVRELDAVGDLAGLSVWRDQRDDPWLRRLPAHEVESHAVHVDVGATIHDDLVPAVAGQVTEIGVLAPATRPAPVG